MACVHAPYAPFFPHGMQRAASVYGDLRYQANRRLFLGALAKNNVTTYSYLYAQVHEGDAASVGVPHGSDLSGEWGVGKPLDRS